MSRPPRCEPGRPFHVQKSLEGCPHQWVGIRSMVLPMDSTSAFTRGTLLLTCPKIAASKGRDAVSWFFLGALLGPFGLIFALLARETGRGQGRTQMPILRRIYQGRSQGVQALRTRSCGTRRSRGRSRGRRKAERCFQPLGHNERFRQNMRAMRSAK